MVCGISLLATTLSSTFKIPAPPLSIMSRMDQPSSHLQSGKERGGRSRAARALSCYQIASHIGTSGWRNFKHVARRYEQATARQLDN
jgi:hypothetical protein